MISLLSILSQVCGFLRFAVDYITVCGFLRFAVDYVTGEIVISSRNGVTLTVG